MKKSKSIFVIKDKEGNFCTFGTKCAWVSKGAAKNAFRLHVREYSKGYGTGIKIEDQEEYEVIEIFCWRV